MTANAETVGFSKTCRTWTAQSNAWRIREATTVARSEWPPSSKKLSSTPTWSMPRATDQMLAITSSVGVLGSTKEVLVAPSSVVGAGRALWSILPVGVVGRVVRWM